MEYAIIFLPLIGSIIGYFGKSIGNLFAELTTTVLTSCAAVLSLIVFYNGIYNGDYGNYKIYPTFSMNFKLYRKFLSANMTNPLGADVGKISNF